MPYDLFITTKGGPEERRTFRSLRSPYDSLDGVAQTVGRISHEGERSAFARAVTEAPIGTTVQHKSGTAFRIEEVTA